MSGHYYVYMLTGWNNAVLYIGVSNHLERRVMEHRSQSVPGFTQKYNLRKLVWFEMTHDVTAAIEREKQLKKWRRDKKNLLVAAMNPEWKDLSEGWFQDPSTTLGMTDMVAG